MRQKLKHAGSTLQAVGDWLLATVDYVHCSLKLISIDRRSKAVASLQKAQKSNLSTAHEANEELKSKISHDQKKLTAQRMVANSLQQELQSDNERLSRANLLMDLLHDCYADWKRERLEIHKALIWAPCKAALEAVLLFDSGDVDVTRRWRQVLGAFVGSNHECMRDGVQCGTSSSQTSQDDARGENGSEDATRFATTVFSEWPRSAWPTDDLDCHSDDSDTDADDEHNVSKPKDQNNARRNRPTVSSSHQTMRDKQHCLNLLMHFF